MFPQAFCKHRYAENGREAQRAIDINKLVKNCFESLDIENIKLDSYPYISVIKALFYHTV